MTAPDPLLDIVRPAPRRTPPLDAEWLPSTYRQPGFWLGLCANRDPHDLYDAALIAGYERVAETLRAEPTRDPRSIPQVADWLSRRVTVPGRMA